MLPLAGQCVTKQGEQYRNHAHQLDRERRGLRENGLTPRARGSALTWIWLTEQAPNGLALDLARPTLGARVFETIQLARFRTSGIASIVEAELPATTPHAKFERRCGG